MKYFTPELFTRCNDKDIDKAVAAEEVWERQIKRYHRHFRKIESQLSESVRQFCNECCLHDADVFGPARLKLGKRPGRSDSVCIVTYNLNTLVPKHLNTMIVLQYVAVKEPNVTVPLPSTAFHGGQTIWLYDEFDLVEPGVFSHEILLSDGRAIRILFREFQYDIAPLVLPADNSKARAKSKKRAVPA